MTLTRPTPYSIFRTCVLILMMGLILAFTSAETRARVMVRVTEESGVSRFYEDKVGHVATDVVRLRHAQHGRKPTELPIPRDRAGLRPNPTALTGRAYECAAGHRSTHRPRAPPAHA